MLSQAPKLIRQLSTDPRLDAEIKTEAQQVLKIALYLKYDFNKLSRSNNRINRKDQHVFKFTPPFSYLKYIFIWNSAVQSSLSLISWFDVTQPKRFDGTQTQRLRSYMKCFFYESE